ncbi:MAG TPA: maleylpyruvate isomerase N-terminal domain-containing protein [Candidatus Dormibacteraeota bacterium]|nr:maleylpyruvate isomerase N-terminal domain-containing protein [Candidatus Dormibacteraeota bacterium]
MSEASLLADDYDATMAEVIALAKSCSDEDWRTLCPKEERTVGVLFDHIATGNPQVITWVDTFLAGKPVEITPESLAAQNAEHAHKTAKRPRHQTIGDLDSSTPRTSAAIRALDEDQLRKSQQFGWAGRQDVGWVASAAVRHPRGHLKSIREALGR